MHTKLYLLTIGIAIALVGAGCSKKSSSPTSPQTSNAPTFPSVVVKGPTTNSTDQYAQTTKAYATEANALTSTALFAAFSGLNPTQNGSTWTWTVTEQTLTVTFTETQQADGSLTWSWKQNGTDPQTQVVYNNWVFFSGTHNADGKSGDWKVYNDNTTTVAGDYAWSTNASGVLTATLTSYNTDGTLDGKLVIVNNTDNSGEVDVYTGTVLTFKATWVASGSGTWWTYNSTSGTQTSTGTWS
jgi:hypothetical protein